MIKLKNIITNIFSLTGFVLAAWLLLSFLEIANRSIYGGATYSDYNIIVTITNYYMNITGGFF